jgi:hypothetical protein
VGVIVASAFNGSDGRSPKVWRERDRRGERQRHCGRGGWVSVPSTSSVLSTAVVGFWRERERERERENGKKKQGEKKINPCGFCFLKN